MHKSFNKEYAASVPKEQWIKEHDHLKDDFDLSSEWESAQPEKPTKPAKKED